MICPRCKSEYMEGATTCADCGVELLEGTREDFRGNEAQYVKFVTVAATTNYFLVPLAKSILESAEIVYFVKGDHLQNIPGSIVEIEIQVPEEDVEIARELLSDIDL